MWDVSERVEDTFGRLQGSLSRASALSNAFTHLISEIVVGKGEGLGRGEMVELGLQCNLFVSSLCSDCCTNAILVRNLHGVSHSASVVGGCYKDREYVPFTPSLFFVLGASGCPGLKYLNVLSNENAAKH